MYLPKHLRANDDETSALLTHLSAANLITATAAGPWATFMPLIHQPAANGYGSLLGHVARKNEHWKLDPIGESLVILQGPDAYITPNWYPSKQEHGRVVPTWTYITAHVYGQLVIHDDTAWLGQVVRMLTQKYEAQQPAPWSVDDAPAEYIDNQLRAIVGIELKISRIEAKVKLEQNETTADIDGVIAGLKHIGDHENAAAISRTRHN